MVSFTQEQNIICSQTLLDGIGHEQIIICRYLFAGHMVGSQPMKRKKHLLRMVRCIMGDVQVTYRIFSLKNLHKMEFSSQRRAMLLFLTTKVAGVTSHANPQFMTFSNPLQFYEQCCTYHRSIELFSLVTSYKQCFTVCTSLPSCPCHKNFYHVSAYTYIIYSTW